MKAIILAAGYATRLYPLTLNTPKPLLEIAGKTMIDYIVDGIEAIDEIDEIYVITNHKFYNHFKEWEKTRETSKTIRILDDNTTSDEDKLGAIGDIRFVLEKESIDDDIMVLAGDNFFTFNLEDFYSYFKKVDGDCVCIQKLYDPGTLKRMAIALLDGEGRVTDMEEKPQKPKSNNAVFAFYIYKKGTLPLFEQYIAEGNNPDAPGHFPSWLYKVKDVYAFIFNGECYDIGTPEAYREVQEKFKDRVACM